MTILLVLLAALTLGAPTIAPAQTQADMNAESCDDAKKADAELNAAYKQLMTNVAGNPKVIERIKAAQRAWVAFRDAQIGLLYPPDEPLQGSVMPMCTCLATAELTADRTKQLQRMITGEEGDVCSWALP